MYKIERNVPLAQQARKGHRAYLYPFHEMKIGDSFLAKGKTMQTVGPSISNAKYRLERDFTARTCKDGVRVWRIG